MRATVAPEQEPNPLMAMFMGDPDTFRVAIPGQTFGVKVHVVNQSSRKSVTCRDAWRSLPTQKKPWQMSPGQMRHRKPSLRHEQPVDDDVSRDRAGRRGFHAAVLLTAPISSSPITTSIDERFLNQPLAPYPFVAWAEFTYEGAPIRVGQ